MRNDLNTEIHLRVVDLSHEYGIVKSKSKAILKTDSIKSRGIYNVNLDVKFGEFIGVLGPNGCGKSTLLKTLNSSLIPEHGKILIADRELSPLNNDLKRQIGVVFQDVALDPKLTVSQN